MSSWRITEASWLDKTWSYTAQGLAHWHPSNREHWTSLTPDAVLSTFCLWAHLVRKYPICFCWASSPWKMRLCFHLMWEKKIIFYNVYLDGVERTGPKTGNRVLEILFFRLSGGMKKHFRDTSCVCLSSSSDSSWFSSLLSPWPSKLTTDCQDLEVGVDHESATITMPFCSIRDIVEIKEHCRAMDF